MKIKTVIQNRSQSNKQKIKKIIGNGLPKHLLSWDNSFTFKNFDLGITMRGAFDYDILNYPRMFYECPVNLTRGNLLATAYEPKYGKTVLNDQQELNMLAISSKEETLEN